MFMLPRLMNRSIWLASALLLVACSAWQPPAAWPADVPPRNPAIAQAPITLQVWLAADYVDTPPIQTLIRDFEQAYPNIDVQPTGVLWENMINSVELAIYQGSSPDVAHSHAFALGARGLAEPLDEYWQVWGADAEFMPGALDDVIWRGTYYGVPLDINALFTIYNKRLLRAAGVSEPEPDWTLDDFERMLPLLTARDRSQYALPLTSSGWAMAGMIHAAGGSLIAERDGRIVATLDTPQVRRTLQLFRMIGVERQYGTLPPPIMRQSDHPVSLFTSGKVALFFSGPWDLARIRNEAPHLIEDVGTAPLPRGDGVLAGGSVQGGGSLFVPRDAQHPEAAFEFMKWAVADPYAKRMALEQGRYPVRTRLYDDPALRSDPLLQPFFEQLRTARPYKLEAYYNADQTWKQTVRDVFDPSVDLDQTIARAQTLIQQQIDDVENAARP
jgi:ABC-type glycerol-3-phosphate transport system substrate-binding protein